MRSLRHQTFAIAAVIAAITLSVGGVIGAPPASAQPGGPVITGVSQVVAQSLSTLGETSGPGIIITGSGFGATAPVSTQTPTPGGSTVGGSALGVDANTSHLQIEVTSPGIFSDSHSFMGLFPNNNTFGDCYVTIGSWSDTQITVLLDDEPSAVSCSSIGVGNTITVQVWDTVSSTPSNVFNAAPAVAPGTTASLSAMSPVNGPTTGGTFTDNGTQIPTARSLSRAQTWRGPALSGSVTTAPDPTRRPSPPPTSRPTRTGPLPSCRRRRRIPTA
jgi:hypothetical protein